MMEKSFADGHLAELCESDWFTSGEVRSLQHVFHQARIVLRDDAQGVSCFIRHFGAAKTEGQMEGDLARHFMCQGSLFEQRRMEGVIARVGWRWVLILCLRFF